MPTFIEVCAGAGGMSTGLIRAGWTPLALLDNNKDCCDTLRTNHPQFASTVKRVDVATVVEPFWSSTVDLLVGGMPCQSFSYSGTKRGLADPRGNLILKFIQMIPQVNPKLVLIENVKGLASHANGQTLRRIGTEITRLGYTVSHRILNANDFGTPQRRERLILVATRTTLHFLDPLARLSVVVPKPTLATVLSAPYPDDEGIHYSPAKLPYFERIPPGGCWKDLPEEMQKAYLGKSYSSPGGQCGILRRLSLTEASPTILCSPSQKRTERCHPTEVRPLTVKESAAIQSFPPSYVFCGSITSKYRQIGNAVPVELAYHLGIMLRKTIRRIQRSHTR